VTDGRTDKRTDTSTRLALRAVACKTFQYGITACILNPDASCEYVL